MEGTSRENENQTERASCQRPTRVGCSRGVSGRCVLRFCCDGSAWLVDSGIARRLFRRRRGGRDSSAMARRSLLRHWPLCRLIFLMGRWLHLSPPAGGIHRGGKAHHRRCRAFLFCHRLLPTVSRRPRSDLSPNRAAHTDGISRDAFYTFSGSRPLPRLIRTSRVAAVQLRLLIEAMEHLRLRVQHSPSGRSGCLRLNGICRVIRSVLPICFLWKLVDRFPSWLAGPVLASPLFTPIDS